MEYDVYVASSGLIKVGKEAEICFQPNKTEKENKKQREKKTKERKKKGDPSDRVKARSSSTANEKLGFS